MKKISLISTMLLLFGCSSIISRNSVNDIKIEAIIIPTAQCKMCVANIENALNEIDGIIKYKVELKSYKVKVKYNSDKISLQSIEQLISRTGYQANNLPADLEAYNKLAMCCRLPKDRR